MTAVIQFAVLGIGTGAAYTLIGQGLVLTFRGSGVVNFAQGALAMAAAFVFFQLAERSGWAFAPALVVACLVAGAIGVLAYRVVMRPLEDASMVTKAIGTLGVYILLEGLATLIWGTSPRSVHSTLPTSTLEVGSVVIGWDKLILAAIAVALTAVLALAAHRTRLGLAIRANAENRRAAAALAWSPHRLGALTWGLGAVLAAIAGVLLAPLTGITVDQMPLLVIPVLAAVLIGEFESFWLTLAAAMFIGIAQSEIGQYVHITGAQAAFPFLVIIVYLMVRGEAASIRTATAKRLASIGDGIVRPAVALPAVAIAVALLALVHDPNVLSALTVTFAWAIVVLSVVLLVGYAGQLSLLQFAIGGVAALVAGKLIVGPGLPFWAAACVAVLACVAVGMVFSIPAARTRGINLAIVTLGLSVGLSELVFTNGSFTGGYEGLDVGELKLFGWEIDTLFHPTRYAFVVLALLVLATLMVAGIRRGASGSRLIAVRTNERAAAALGVDVVGAKVFAFGLAAGVAAIGGLALAFMNDTLTFSQGTYAPLQSIRAVAFGVVGGVGYVAGAAPGATLASGGIGNWLLNDLFPDANQAWLTVVAGASLLALVVLQPDGLVRANIDMFRALAGRLPLRAPRLPWSGRAERLPEPGRSARRAAALSVRDLTVRFSGVTAVEGVSLDVAPGQVVGLIGPNGAGKTTLIDAVTGFVRPQRGEISLGGRRLDGLRPNRRARAGLSRSFQSLELFEDSTIGENLRVACDDGGWSPYLTDLVVPRRVALSATGAAALREFGLEDEIEERVADLPYGRRRLVAIARAVSTEPAVLLLDEPAAGLSEAETGELADVVRRLAAEWGIGILVVEHDMGFVMSVCDRIVVLDHGSKIAAGTPAEVRADRAVVAAYLGGDGSGRAAETSAEATR